MTVLADTSVWIDYLRAGKTGPAAALDALVASGEAVICGPVLAELLVGFAPPDREAVWHALASLPWAELDRAGWREVGELAHELRAAGAVVALTDVEIAVAAMRSGATLWTRDSDFDRLRALRPSLELYPA